MPMILRIIYCSRGSFSLIVPGTNKFNLIILLFLRQLLTNFEACEIRNHIFSSDPEEILVISHAKESLTELGLGLIFLSILR